MKGKKIHTGHSIAEARSIIDKAIDQSVERLRRRLRVAWKKQRGHAKQEGQHRVTV